MIFKIFYIYKNNALLLRQGLKYEFYCTCFKGTVVIYVEWEGKKGGVKAIFDWPEGGGEGGYLTFYREVFRGGQYFQVHFIYDPFSKVGKIVKSRAQTICVK